MAKKFLHRITKNYFRHFIYMYKKMKIFYGLIKKISDLHCPNLFALLLRVTTKLLSRLSMTKQLKENCNAKTS